MTRLLCVSAPSTCLLLFSLVAFPVFARERGENCNVELVKDGECGDDLTCQISDVPFIQCAPGKPAGKPCRGNVDCARGYHCSAPPPNGVCRESRAENEICNDLGHCNEREDVACFIGGETKCLPRRSEGERCEDDGSFFFHAQCKSGLFCSGLPGNGRCVPLRAEGEVCVSIRECALGLTCNFAAGVCGSYPGEGEPCTSLDVSIPGQQAFGYSSDCASDLECVDSKCSARSSQSGASSSADEKKDDSDNEAKNGSDAEEDKDDSDSEAKIDSDAEEDKDDSDSEDGKGDMITKNKIRLATAITSMIASVYLGIIGCKDLKRIRS